MSLYVLRLAELFASLKSDLLLFWEGMRSDKGLWVTVLRQGRLDYKGLARDREKERLCEVINWEAISIKPN